MKIKTKLTAVLLLIALVPLAVVSIASYLVARNSMDHQVLRQLESVASIQQSRVETAVQQDRERLSLLQSRTALRNDLQTYEQRPSEQGLAQLNQILSDASAATEAIKDIHLLDTGGTIVASTDPSAIGEDRSADQAFTRGRSENVVNIFSRSTGGKLMQTLAGPLKVGNETIGVLVVDCDSSDLVDITSDYSGLGKTGETVLAMRNAQGDAVFITPLRFDRNAELQRVISRQRLSTPITRALSGINALQEDAPDYRGIPVLAVTRYIKDPGYGLVTKIDESEAFRPVNNLGVFLILIVAGALVLVLIFSLLIARTITRPVTELTEAAIAISDGDLSRRAMVQSRDEIGRLAGAFNTMTDDLVEARESLERKVEERTAELALANTELDGYAHTVSHDLKGPLTAVSLASQLLHELLKRPDYQDAEADIEDSLEIIDRNIGKSFELVDDLLALAEASQVPQTVSRVDISEVVKRVLHEKEANILEKGVRVELIEDLGHVVGDQTQMYQVFSNLIGNAIKHNTSSEPSIGVSYLGDDDDGAHRYLVRDNGSGIADEDMDSLFVPFFKGPTGETGVGLATVKKVIEIYGGEIRAYNDGGACFEFTISDLEETGEERP
jgi:signal transduction histidine kinase